MIRIQNQRQVTRSTNELTERLRQDQMGENDSIETSDFKINDSKDRTISESNDYSKSYNRIEPIQYGKLSSIINIVHNDEEKKMRKNREVPRKTLLQEYAEKRMDLFNQKQALLD